jgi:hypothetical protein
MVVSVPRSVPISRHRRTLHVPHDVVSAAGGPSNRASSVTDHPFRQVEDPVVPEHRQYWQRPSGGSPPRDASHGAELRVPYSGSSVLPPFRTAKFARPECDRSHECSTGPGRDWFSLGCPGPARPIAMDEKSHHRDAWPARGACRKSTGESYRATYGRPGRYRQGLGRMRGPGPGIIQDDTFRCGPLQRLLYLTPLLAWLIGYARGICRIFHGGWYGSSRNSIQPLTIHHLHRHE